MSIKTLLQFVPTSGKLDTRELLTQHRKNNPGTQLGRGIGADLPPLKKVLWLVPILAIMFFGGLILVIALLLRPHPSFKAFVIPSVSMCPTICLNERMIADMSASKRAATSRRPDRAEASHDRGALNQTRDWTWRRHRRVRWHRPYYGEWYRFAATTGLRQPSAYHNWRNSTSLHHQSS